MINIIETQKKEEEYSLELKYDYLKENINKIVVVYGVQQKNDQIIIPRWQKEKEKYLYQGKIKNENLVQIPKEMIILEFDHYNDTPLEEAKEEAKEYIQKIKGILTQKKVYFWITDHKGKSPHIRIPIKGLQYYDFEFIKEYKKQLIEKLLINIGFRGINVCLDMSLINSEYKLVSLEKKPHWKSKWKGEKEEIIFENKNGKVTEVNETTMKKIIKEFTSDLKKDNNKIKEISIDYLNINMEKLIDFFKLYWKSGQHNSMALAFAGICARGGLDHIQTVNIFNKIMAEINQKYLPFSSVTNYCFNIKKEKIAVFHWIKNCIDEEDKANICYSELKQAFNIINSKEVSDSFNSFRFEINDYQGNVEKFKEIQPFFYDKSGSFWFWNKKECKWEMLDDIDVMNNLDSKLNFNGATIKNNTKTNYLEAFKRVGRLSIPKEPPKSWIQFKNTIFDINTKESFEATPDYFCCNPIPWGIGQTEKTPVMDSLFNQWVGVKFTPVLYEILAYCCISDYPIHLMFCFIGSGRNGKSSFQNLLTRFIGNSNVCSTELDLLIDNRFESTKLYKKLVCSLGETNFGKIKKTSLLKKLSGQDMIGFEFKNKSPFDDYNYAKIIINSNSLPSSDDMSDGFYRRWFIIDFPNEFDEVKDVLAEIPDEEYSNLCKKIIGLVPELIKNRRFTNEGSIEERKKRYISASNPLSLFIEHCCDKGDMNDFVFYDNLYNTYCQFLMNNKRRVIKRNEFNDALLQEGLEKQRTYKTIGENSVRDWFINGISIKHDWDRFNLSTLSTLSTKNELDSMYKGLSEKGMDNLDKMDKSSIRNSKIDYKEINLNCNYCGLSPCSGYNLVGQPVCKHCMKDVNLKKYIVEETL